MMTFLKSRRAQTTVEWMVILVIVVVVLGGMIWTLYDSLGTKLQAYHDAL
jgi:Flp pilus assembly pilin Flp